MAGEQILLLPRVDYFKWVRAVQKYALHYGISITPDPVKVGTYQTVTAVIPPDGYPHEGNIEVWLQRRYPNVRLDAVHVGSAETLSEIFAQRVEKNQRYGALDDKSILAEPGPAFRKDRLYLFWPTDYPIIEQPFGTHPEIYSQFGLPGHEGVDIRAPHDSPVYACAAGEVYMVEDGEGGHNYGQHVRIQHANGYRTVYAHLKDVEVKVGDQVEARQRIGKASASGNSSRPCLHLTLKKDEATQRGETNFPGDVIDPTPFLVFPHLEKEVRAALGMPEESEQPGAYPWTRPCLVGLNARPAGDLQDADFDVFRIAKIEAVKITQETSSESIKNLREISAEMFILAQIVHFPEDGEWSAFAWLESTHQQIERLYRENVRYFEIQRLPNLQQFGWSRYWHSGEAFGDWWLEVYQSLRKGFPEARFGFPSVMPGGQVPGQRLDAEVFLEGADDAMLAADWLGVVCYWEGVDGRESQTGGRFYQAIRQRFPDKLLFITEFGNTSQKPAAAAKGQEYLDYYQSLRELPGIGAAFAQVVSSASGYDALVWRSEEGEENGIARVVGGRAF